MNEKQIVKGIISKDHPEMEAVEHIVVDITKKTFSTIADQVKGGGSVLVKNFGTFAMKKRKPRRRFDQGLKKVVETEPKQIIEFTQSPNVFRDEEE